MRSDLAPLARWLEAHPDPDERVRVELRAGWIEHVGGHRVIHPCALGYTATVDTFWAALAAAGWEEVDTSGYLGVMASWRTSMGVGQFGADDLGLMDPSTLCHALRWIDRSELFCDGSWAGYYHAGLFHAGARAALASGPLVRADDDATWGSARP